MKYIDTFKQKSTKQETMNVSDISDMYIKENKTQLESEVEVELIKFFEGFADRFKIDRNWVIDRFNDEETENFINYICKVLSK